MKNWTGPIYREGIFKNKFSFDFTMEVKSHANFSFPYQHSLSMILVALLREKLANNSQTVLFFKSHLNHLIWLSVLTSEIIFLYLRVHSVLLWSWCCPDCRHNIEVTFLILKTLIIKKLFSELKGKTNC